MASRWAVQPGPAMAKWVVRVNRMSPRGPPRVPSADWRGRDSVAIVF
jgi:hypothetical protein